jgi:hypothetical protein
MAFIDNCSPDHSKICDVLCLNWLYAYIMTNRQMEVNMETCDYVVCVISRREIVS